jgi:hypothetical protein
MRGTMYWALLQPIHRSNNIRTQMNVPGQGAQLGTAELSALAWHI